MIAPRHVAALAAFTALAACAGHEPAAPDTGLPPLPCAARLGGAPGSTVLFTGVVYNMGYFPRLEWSADARTLFVNAADGDVCARFVTPTTVPSLVSLSVATHDARPVIPFAGETSAAVPTAGGRAVLYFTPVEKVNGQDVYGLVRVWFAGTADTLLRGVPRPLTVGVDTAARAVVLVAPGVRLSVRDMLPDTLVTLDVATGRRRAVAPLNAVGTGVVSVAPDGSAAIVGTLAGRTPVPGAASALVVRLADGARVGTLPGTDPIAAIHWRAGGVDVLTAGTDTPASPTFDVVHVPEGTHARVARLQGPTYPGALDWLADGTLLAWEERVDAEPWRPAVSPPDDGLAHVVGALRQFAPGDTSGREILRGTFDFLPYQVRVSPDRSRIAFATGSFVATTGRSD